ncbi:MAG: transporter substrate-binding domain-containing protein [Lactobacillus sp.]|nr:transporter substrate-binding domain-containing protein [Lactobacillus sp.]MDN6052836.1 transporter substrate-binding domain-containing protein [Lactobacillus sp.]
MKLIHKISLTLGTLGLVCLLAGCSQGQSQDKSIETIKAKKTLVLGTSADYAPFEFPIIKNGQKEFAGYDILVAKELAKSLGVSLKVDNIEFSSLISELQNKKCDVVLAGLTPTPQRKKVISFSQNYCTYNFKNVLLVQKKDANRYNTAASLANQSVGVQQSTTQEDIANKQLKASHIIPESLVTGLATELSHGKLAGIVVENTIANDYLKLHPGKYAIAKVPLKTPAEGNTFAVGVRKQDRALLKKINQKLTEMKKSGKLEQLLKQALETQAKYSK